MTLDYTDMIKALNDAAALEAAIEREEELRERVKEFERGEVDYHASIESLTEERDEALQREKDLIEVMEEAIRDIQNLLEVPLGGVPDAIDAIETEMRVHL